jgi:hypothetical protein
LKRVVGAGKRRTRKSKGGEMPEPASPPSESDEMADKEGREFAKHLAKLKGKKFLDGFHKGLMAAAGEEEISGGAMPPTPIVPPGGVPAVASGNPPQAPASFVRNSVSLDREAPTLKGAAKPKAKRAPSARGQMIAQLMKEHGLTLGEASKRLKSMA